MFPRPKMTYFICPIFSLMSNKSEKKITFQISKEGIKEFRLEVTQTSSSNTGIVVNKFNSRHLILADPSFANKHRNDMCEGAAAETLQAADEEAHCVRCGPTQKEAMCCMHV